MNIMLLKRVMGGPTLKTSGFWHQMKEKLATTLVNYCEINSNDRYYYTTHVAHYLEHANLSNFLLIDSRQIMMPY